MLQNLNFRGLLAGAISLTTLKVSPVQTPVVTPIDFAQLEKISTQLGGVSSNSVKLNDGDKIVTITRGNQPVFAVVFPVSNAKADPSSFINLAQSGCGVRGGEITVGLFTKKT